MSGRRRVEGGKSGRDEQAGSSSLAATSPPHEEMHLPEEALVEKRWWSRHSTEVVIALAGILVSLVIFWVSRKEKVPCYYIESTSLVAPSGEGIPGLGITFQGKPVKRVTSTSVTIWNAGRETIRREDIPGSDRLRISVPKGVSVLSAKIIKTSRTPVQGTLEVRNGNIYVAPNFLDKNDGVVVQVLHTGGAEGVCHVTGTIIGASRRLQVVNKDLSAVSWVLIFPLLILLVMMVVTSKYEWTDRTITRLEATFGHFRFGNQFAVGILLSLFIVISLLVLVGAIYLLFLFIPSVPPGLR